MKFFDFSNRHVSDIPTRVIEWAKGKHGLHYCSEIGKFYGKLYEVVYGVKVLKKGTYIQRLVMIPEDGETLIRNCYYSWGYSCGFHSYGYDGKGKKFNSFEGYDYEAQFGEACKEFPVTRIQRTLLTTTQEIAKLDDVFRYVCWHDNGYIQPIDYLRIYRAFPKQAEMLMKFRIIRMISMNNCEKLSNEPMFHRWLERHHERLSHTAFQTAYNSWKKNPEVDVSDYEKSLAYRIMCGREIAQRNRPVYEKAMRYTTQEKLYEWEKTNRINAGSYMDYLIACDWLKLDFSDTKVLFPRNFQEVHDNYVGQYSLYKNEVEKKRIEKENRTREKRMKKQAEKFKFLAYHDADYLVLVAQGKQDLIDEGSALNHCVGRMDYDERMANGSEVICFIRKKDEPTKPFVTAQVIVGKQKLSVNQCYGFKDSIVPEVNDFKDKWIKYANRRYKNAV